LAGHRLLIDVGQLVQRPQVLGKPGHGGLGQVREIRTAGTKTGSVGALLTHVTPETTAVGRARGAVPAGDAGGLGEARRPASLGLCEAAHKSRSWTAVPHGAQRRTPTRTPADREMPPRHNVPFILDPRARVGACSPLCRKRPLTQPNPNLRLCGSWTSAIAGAI